MSGKKKRNFYSKIKKYILIKTKKESNLSYLFNFLYQIFTNEIFAAIISLLETVVIALMINFNYFKIGFWITIIIYILSVLCIAFANKYQKEKAMSNKILKQSLAGLNQTLRAWAIELQKSAKTILNLHIKSSEAINNAVKRINFQSAAFTVCRGLCNNLTKYYENDDVYVTVYQKQITDSGNFCKMIAYSCEHEPSTYAELYDIPEFAFNLYGKIEYHTYLFSSNQTDISVLHNRENVDKAFVTHEKSKKRECEIQQYIAIPIAPAKLGVTFILQVDTNVADLFGKNEEDVKALAKISIYPYAQFLHLIYEQSRTIEQLIGGVIIE